MEEKLAINSFKQLYNMKWKNLFAGLKKRFFLLTILTCVLSSTQLIGQEKFSVSGTVLDADDSSGLIGATVIEKGTTNGTSTDIEGNFSLDVANGDAVLVISYTGYAMLEIPVDNQSKVSVSLSAGSTALDEVVLIGYKTIKKNDLTGAVGSLDDEALTSRSMNNPLEAIQGNLAGVQISQSTGRLGDGLNVTIRGNNSLNEGSNPLYVVDGVPTDNIDFLNPQDIARIDVLKDASSTAIYGSRGSNGVVIVSTKNGAGAKPGISVTLDSYFGVKKVARLPEMMSPEKWWYYHRSAYIATAGVDDPLDITPELLESKYLGDSNPELKRRAEANEAYDWYDLVLQDGYQQNTYLNVSGRGAGGVGYNLGFGIQNETGHIDNESLDKYTLKLGIHQNIGDFTFGINTTLALNKDQLGSELAMREAFRLNPFLSPYGPDGVTLYNQPGKLKDENGDWLINKTSTYNPILEIANSSDETRTVTGIGSAFVQYKPLEWLSFKSTFSPGMTNSRRGRSWGAQTNTGISNNNLPSAEVDNFQNLNYTWDNQIDVEKTLGNGHKLTLLGLQSIYSTQSEGTSLSARELPFDTDIYNLGSGLQSTYGVGSFFSKQTLASFALRANYSINDKYIITLSNRLDGSSLLSEDNRWDNFPSAAVAWNIGQENFLVNNQSISYLKLRASYGFTGNNIIDPYSTTNILDRQTYYDYNGSTANGWLPSALANNNLGWEKTREFNFGVDFGIFKERVVGSIDIYDRLSDDLLIEQDLPVETGFESISSNIGSVSNKGVELSLTTRNIQKPGFTWQTTFTFTRNRNEVVSIYGQSEVDDIGNGWFIGESINSHYNYEFDGIWQQNEADLAESYGQSEGQAKVVDINNDGTIDPDDDRKILGSSDPSWTGGLFSTLSYKNFDFSFSVLTAQDVFVSSNFHANFTNTRDRGRQKLDIADWYIPENGAGIPAQFSNEYPQARNMGTFWRNDGVGYYRDASFVKIKNIALGYTFAKPAMDKVGLGSLRVYVNVINPFVFTDYDGYDPEWAGASYNIARVASVTYQVGVNVKF